MVSKKEKENSTTESFILGAYRDTKCIGRKPSEKFKGREVFHGSKEIIG